MYNLIGFNQNIKNIYYLASQYCKNNKIASTSDLKEPYINFLKNYQPDFIHNTDNEKVVTNINLFKNLKKAYGESSLNDLQQEQMLQDFLDNSKLEKKIKRINKALKYIKNKDPKLYHLFDLCIHSIIVTDSHKNSEGFQAHGGTSNKCIGLIWVTLKDTLTDQDIVELLIHELTHTLVFIDEICNPQFNYEHITKKWSWAKSAILNRLRPMDKVVHSIIVSHEILSTRNQLFNNQEDLTVHPTSYFMMTSIKKAIHSVLNHDYKNKICLGRAIELTKIVDQKYCIGEL